MVHRTLLVLALLTISTAGPALAQLPANARQAPKEPALEEWLTPVQLRELLAHKLAEYVPSPSVSVIVNEVRSFKVSVIGEVVRPARYELKSRRPRERLFFAEAATQH
jgi:hypothetical protein